MPSIEFTCAIYRVYVCHLPIRVSLSQTHHCYPNDYIVWGHEEMHAQFTDAQEIGMKGGGGIPMPMHENISLCDRGFTIGGFGMGGWVGL